MEPLRLIDPGEWHGKRAPDREWLVPGICVRGGATLLNGDGGVGKSLLCMQLQTALALGAPWLGIQTPSYGISSLGIYCEDEPDELQRRQEDINRYYGCSHKDISGLVTMMSRAGQANTLMSFNRRDGGSGTITNFFRQVESYVISREVQCVIIDTAADTFGGLEIDREQVRGFVQRLRGWALETRGTIIITQHPSVSGMASGAGSSGSTGWNNSVRSRVYLTKPKRVDDDGDEIPTNERFLKFMKSNYGPTNQKLRLRYQSGVFVTSEEGPGTFFDAIDLQDQLFEAAVQFVRMGVELSPDPQARTALVNRVRAQNEKFSVLNLSHLMKAQEELLSQGRLVTTTMKSSDGRKRSYLKPFGMSYPSEVEGNP
jgi:RecA-family ATPase